MKTIILILLVILPIGFADAAEKVARKTQKVDFDGSEVDGQIRTPDGSYLLQRRGVKFSPLYNVRDKFDEEIKTSVDYLK